MKNAGFIMICVVALMSSCSDSATKSEAENKDAVTTVSSDSNTDVNPAKPAPDSVIAPKEIDWAGTYKTDFPPGYDMTELMLHKDSTYMYTAQYFGDKKRTVKLNGKFSFTGAGAIRLENAKDEPADYLLKENEITQVNKDPKSEVVITLKKVK
jgi:hypothetical protein